MNYQKNILFKSMIGPHELVIDVEVDERGVALGVDRLDSSLIIQFALEALPRLIPDRDLNVIEIVDAYAGFKINNPHPLTLEWQNHSFRTRIYTIVEPDEKRQYTVSPKAQYSLEILGVAHD